MSPASEPPRIPSDLAVADRIDLLCDAFERDWLDGKAPSLEEFVARIDTPAQTKLFRELLRLDLDYRSRLGTLIAQEEYVARFPDQQGVIAEVFEALPSAALTLRSLNSIGEIAVETLVESIGGAEGLSRKGWTPIGVVGDYELLLEIARGGMGVVYLARQRRLNRLVAVKMILSGKLASEDDVKRFYLEAESAAKLEHPHIVPIYEVGEHQKQHFYSMAFVDGPSLSKLLQSGPLLPHEAADLLAKTADAVQYAHEQGIIHRDLKPANILLSPLGGHAARQTGSATQLPDGNTTERIAASKDSASNSKSARTGSSSRTQTQKDQTQRANYIPKVTDFGLAKQTTAGDSGMTSSGAIVGTPSYMPPEQAAGRIREISPASDVYSLGAILYETLVGRPPFRAASIMETLRQVMEKEPVKPRLLDPQVDRDLETICLKCLEKDSTRRYATAGELADDLRRFLNGEPVHARPVGPIQRAWRWCKRKPAVVAAMAAMLVAAVALAVAWSGRQAAQRTQRLTELQQAFNDGVESVTLEPGSLRSLEASIIVMESANPEMARKAKQKLHERYAALVEHVVQQPKWTEDDRARIEAALDSLAARDAVSAGRLRQEFHKRSGSWMIAAEAAPPFDNTPSLFAPGRVAVADNFLKVSPRPKAASLPTESVREELPVKTQVRAIGSLRCELTFARDWETAQRLSIAFGDPAKSAHLFVMEALAATKVLEGEDGLLPSASPGKPITGPTSNAATKSTSSEQVNFAATRSNAGRVRLQIRRGDTILQQREIAATELTTSELRVSAERDGTTLTWKVADLEPLRFDDVLPPPVTEGDVLWLGWPSTVSMLGMRASTRPTSELRNPLQQADEHLLAGHWGDAEPLYQAVTGDDVTVAIHREARFKRGLCLLKMKRADDAAMLFRELFSEEDERWAPAAGCQLWILLLTQRQSADAEAVYEQLQSRFRPEQLVRLVAREDRDRLIALHMKDFDSLGQILRRDPDRLRNHEQAAAIDRLLSPDGHGTLAVQFELERAYRFENRLEDALKVSQWADSITGPRDVGRDLVLLRQRARVLRQLNRPAEAVDLLTKWLATPSALPPHISVVQSEMARCRIAMSHWQAAETEIEAVLYSHPTDSTEGLFPAAALLKGFLLERRGELSEAQRIWSEGLQRGRDLKRGRGVASQWFLEQSILGSLTDQPMTSEAEEILSSLSSLGDLGVIPGLIRAAMTPQSLEASMRQAWRSARGREWARRFAYDELTMRDRGMVPLLLFATEFFRRNAFGETVDAEQQEIAAEFAQTMIGGFFVDGSINATKAAQFGLTWKGSFGLFGWGALAPTLDDKTRAVSEFVLAHRALRLNQPAAAIELLKHAQTMGDAHEKVAQLAAADLKLLESKQGKLQLASDWPQPVVVVLERPNEPPQRVTLEPSWITGNQASRAASAPGLSTGNNDVRGLTPSGSPMAALTIELPAGGYQLRVEAMPNSPSLPDTVRVLPDRVTLVPGQQQSATVTWPWKPSGPNGVSGLVSQPAKLPGISRWQALWKFGLAAWRTRPVFDPDGESLIYAGVDGVLRWVNLTDGRITAALPVSRQQAVSLALSPDSRRLAVATADRRVTLIELSTKRIQWSVFVPNGNSALAWSPQGDRLWVGNWNWDTRVLNAEGKSVVSQKTTGNYGEMAAWDPLDRWLATVGSGRSGIHLWSASNFESQQILDVELGRTHALKFSPDGQWLVAVGSNGLLRVWDTKSWQLIYDGPSTTQDVWDVVWHPRGEWFAVLALTEIRCFAIRDRQLEKVSEIPHLGAASLAISADGKQLAALDISPRIGLIDVDSKEVRPFGPKFGFTRATATRWNTDAKTLSAGLSDHSLAGWNRETNRLDRKWLGADGYSSIFRWSPDGRLVATACMDGKVRVWNQDGTKKLEFNGHSKSATEVAWHPEGNRLVSSGADGSVRMFGLDGRAGLVFTPPELGPIQSLDWSANGLHLAALGTNGRLWFCDLESGTTRTADLPISHELHRVRWSPRGDRLAVPNRSSLLVYGPDGERLWEHLHPTAVDLVAWSPDGRQILTVGRDYHARVWTEKGLNAEWPVVSIVCNSAAWTQDGQRVAIGSADGLLRIWNVAEMLPQETLGVTSYSHSVQFSPGGERLSLSPELADQLLYLVESPDGSWRTLTVDEFDELVKSASAKTK